MPVSASKKWNAGRIDGQPQRGAGAGARAGVDAGGEVRPRVVGEQLGAGLALVVRRAQSSASTGAASTGKITCALRAELLDDGDLDVDLGRPLSAYAASSKSSGRMPTIARPSLAGRRFSSSGIRQPAISTTPFATCASTRFIEGEPMNAATNRLTGSR